MATVLIVPIAGDLEWTPEGDVVCGPRTALACETALKHGHKWVETRSANVTIFTPAGRAGPKFKGAPMGWIMHQYLHHAALHHPTIKCGEAEEFTTHGEVEEVLRFLHEQARAGIIYDRVIFVVETWRFSRLAFIANTVVRAHDQVVPCWWIETFDPEEPLAIRLFREVYEFFSRIKNRWRLAQLYPA